MDDIRSRLKNLDSFCSRFNIDIKMNINEIIDHINHFYGKTISDIETCKEYSRLAISALDDAIYIKSIHDAEKYTSDEKINNQNFGYVYVFVGENGRYKIGVSNDHKKRLKDLRRASCEDHKLMFAFIVKKPYKHEAKLHKMFSSKRRHSEWFDLDDNEIKVIEDYLRGIHQ